MKAFATASVLRCAIVALGMALVWAAAPEAEDPNVQYIEARMPDFKVDYVDAYLCTAVPLPEEPLKVVGIEPLAKQEIAHHMLLFGCEAPASQEPVWECHMRSPCGSGPKNTISHGEQVMYGWGRDAPGMHLPEGAGFSVGPRTGIRMAVLQVHYQIVRPEGDHTGVRLKLTHAPQPMSAGMLTYAVGFLVPPKQKSHLVPNSCCYSGFQPLTGFAFRVHAHALGRNIYMERQAYGLGGELQRLVSQDPQEPQGFYPVTKGLRFLPGDPLTVTCDFDSSERDKPTMAGSGSQNEMCNMYMMVTSEIPYFMACGNGNEDVHLGGPGGVPEGLSLVSELESRWQPPPPQAQAPQPGSNAPPVTLGQVAGVAAGVETDTLWVLHRDDRVWDIDTFKQDSDEEQIANETPIAAPAVLQLAKDTGAVLRSWGAGMLVMPHTIAVNPTDGAVWVTDVGLHQALKFDEHGKQLLAIGQRLQPGHDTAHLCKPTAVAFSRTGDVFVADGYCNARVMQYAANGTFVRHYTLAEGKLEVPHGLVVDDCQSALYVADRETAAVHRFRFSSERPLPAASDADPASADTKTRLRARHQRRQMLNAAEVNAAEAAGGSSWGGGSGSLAAGGAAGSIRPQWRAVLQEQDAAAGGAEAGAAGAAGAGDGADGSGGAADAEAGSTGDGGDGDVKSSGTAGRISSFSGAGGAAAEASENDVAADPPDATVDLKEFGPVYGLTAGPYGSVIALCWNREANRVWLLLLDFAHGFGSVARKWEVKGVDSPHDLALTAAPLEITGPGERALAVYIAETRRTGSSLRKFILLPDGVSLEAPPASATDGAQQSAEPQSAEQPLQGADQQQGAAQQQQADQLQGASAEEAQQGTAGSGDSGVGQPADGALAAAVAGYGASGAGERADELQPQSAADRAASEQLMKEEAAKAAQKAQPEATEEAAGFQAQQPRLAVHAGDAMAMSQDPHTPPRREDGGWRSAGARLLLMGLPFAAVFAGMAAVLWWRMSAAQTRFQPVPTRDWRR